jgi:hypothetical protein
MGGSWDHIPWENWHQDEFAQAYHRAIGKEVASDKEIARDAWSALANVEWVHDNGDTASYSFRLAGDLVASMRGEGNYMDWYCYGPITDVSDFIRTAMAEQGWKPVD